MVDKMYLERDAVSSLFHFFAVPKGDSDIQVVYDGTFGGLNDSLWSPKFFLPTARHAGELLNSWVSDMDFGGSTTIFIWMKKFGSTLESTSETSTCACPPGIWTFESLKRK